MPVKSIPHVCETCGKTFYRLPWRLRKAPCRFCSVACRAHHACLKHGGALGGRRSPEYRTWQEMRNRCLRPEDRSWANYGGRGITICDRWSDFANFYADMGPRPSPQHSIDRIDNDGNYSPENCRWITMFEQASNTRKNRFIEHDGLRLTASQWSRRLGIPKATIQKRLRLGFRPADVLSTVPLAAGVDPVTGQFRKVPR